MKTTIRKEMARLWYVLKIAAGQGPVNTTGAGSGLASEVGVAKRVSDVESKGGESKVVEGKHVDAKRSPALVVISRAGRSSVQAQHRRHALADGSRPAYALPYNPQPAVKSAGLGRSARSVRAQGVTGRFVDGDAGIVI